MGRSPSGRQSRFVISRPPAVVGVELTPPCADTIGAMSYDHVEHDRSLRLVFRFDGPSIELLGITESRARPMPAEPVSEQEPTEFWYELRDDDDDSTLYQRPARNPLLAR